MRHSGGADSWRRRHWDFKVTALMSSHTGVKRSSRAEDGGKGGQQVAVQCFPWMDGVTRDA